jgi:hypothetical protein
MKGQITAGKISLPLLLKYQSLNTLLQELLKMNLSSGKLQFWECKKSPVGAGTFCPSPILAFYIPPCRKCLPASGPVPSAVLIQEDS